LELNAFYIISSRILLNKSTKEETGSYVALTFSWAPKKNHDAMTRIGKQNDQIWKKHVMLHSEVFLFSAGGILLAAKALPKSYPRPKAKTF
jgi:hypothetical protein